jgi:hypothetical protein
MNCEQRRDLMPLLLVDALEPAEAAALRAHMAGGCTRCASYLAEADAMLNHLPFALDPVLPPAGARGRLMARVNQATPPAALAYNAQQANRGRLWLPGWARKALPAAIAACLVFVATVQMMLRSQHEQEQKLQQAIADARNKLTETTKTNVMLTTEVAIAKNLYVSSKQITLEGRAQPKAFGRAMWDATRGAWHFKAFNLEQLAAKSDAYQLWFETPYGRKVPTAKTFRPDEHGDVYVVVTLPPDAGPVTKAFVTDEPSVGTQQPTGTVHLWGKVD